MKTIFFGVPDFGTMCLSILMEHGLDIDYVVPPRSDHPAYSAMIGVTQHFDIPVLEFQKSLKEEQFVNKIANAKPDLIIVASFKHLIPPIVYSQAKIAAINCHPSLLPEYRGANPYYYVIANGETETGVTLHHLDASFDTGNIIAQQKEKVNDFETLGTLFGRLNYIGSMMYVDLLTKIKKGYNIPSIPQKLSDTPLKSASPNVDMIHIDWSESADLIDRKVRGANPYIFVKTTYNHRELFIYSGTPHSIKHQEIPGTVLSINHDKLLVAAGTGAYEIRCLRFNSLYFGDSKDFIHNTHIKPGHLIE